MLISASWVASVIGMNLQCPARGVFLVNKLNLKTKKKVGSCVLTHPASLCLFIGELRSYILGLLLTGICWFLGSFSLLIWVLCSFLQSLFILGFCWFELNIFDHFLVLMHSSIPVMRFMLFLSSQFLTDFLSPLCVLFL
jgi:hypothetical protein